MQLPQFQRIPANGTTAAQASRRSMAVVEVHHRDPVATTPPVEFHRKDLWYCPDDLELLIEWSQLSLDPPDHDRRVRRHLQA